MWIACGDLHVGRCRHARLAVISVGRSEHCIVIPVGVEEDRVFGMSAAMLSLGDVSRMSWGRGLLAGGLDGARQRPLLVLVSVGMEAVLTSRS